MECSGVYGGTDDIENVFYFREKNCAKKTCFRKRFLGYYEPDLWKFQTYLCPNLLSATLPN